MSAENEDGVGGEGERVYVNAFLYNTKKSFEDTIDNDCRSLKHEMIQQKQKNFLPFAEICKRVASKMTGEIITMSVQNRVINTLFIIEHSTPGFNCVHSSYALKCHYRKNFVNPMLFS
jgi:hypothetical protein